MCVWEDQMPWFKVLNHASRTLPRLPYTNLKKSRTEKKAGYWACPVETACMGTSAV